MPLLKYFRTLRGKARRGANKSAPSPSDGIKDCIESAGPRDELLLAQKFYAEQETTRNLGEKDRRKGLKKHISGIFII
ncbi:hypothetical protein ACFL4X_00140 [Gemmatimonadota bacterium]